MSPAAGSVEIRVRIQVEEWRPRRVVWWRPSTWRGGQWVSLSLLEEHADEVEGDVQRIIGGAFE